MNELAGYFHSRLNEIHQKIFVIMDQVLNKVREVDFHTVKVTNLSFIASRCFFISHSVKTVQYFFKVMSKFIAE